MISRFLRAVSTHILPGIQAFSRFRAICSGTRPARRPGPSRLRRTATPLRPPPPACAQPVPTAGPRSRGGLVCSFLGAELRFHISREVLSRVTCVDQVLILPRARWPCCEFRGSLAPPSTPPSALGDPWRRRPPSYLGHLSSPAQRPSGLGRPGYVCWMSGRPPLLPAGCATPSDSQVSADRRSVPGVSHSPRQRRRTCSRCPLRVRHTCPCRCLLISRWLRVRVIGISPQLLQIQTDFAF